jgi:succinate-semialdehyde dehydrogenase/glutarate-semialdehyde dehydrogenase
MQMSATIQSVNPADESVLKTYKPHSKEQVERALEKASRSFGDWRKASLKERTAVLKEIARTLRADAGKLAKLATQEMGKPFQQSMDELEKCARTLDFYAKEAPNYLREEIVETDARRSYISYQPLGVVLAVMPWNFPYWQVFRAMAPILAAGNTMVLKHASNVSGCAQAIEKIVVKSGAPKGVFQTLLLPSSEVAGMIESPLVAAITFTGSTAAGRKIAETAGRFLKKQVLELGGSDAYVVLEDADLEKAVETCVHSRLINSGQSCVSAKRFVVVKKLRKAFEERMTTLMKASVFGDPFDDVSRIGPLARVDLRNELHQQVWDSLEQGAKLLCGGYIPDRAGAWYPPTVLTNVRKGMRAYEEELFGPVAAIIEARDEADALRIANDSPFGLGGAIFSKNRKRAEMLAATELQAGSCFVNDFVHSDPRLPFGGVKDSGYGRELGAFGIREFTNAKTVFIK